MVGRRIQVLRDDIEGIRCSNPNLIVQSISKTGCCVIKRLFDRQSRTDCDEAHDRGDDWNRRQSATLACLVHAPEFEFGKDAIEREADFSSLGTAGKVAGHPRGYWGVPP